MEPAEHAAIDATPGIDPRSLDEAPIPTPVIPFHELAGIFPAGDDASIRELAGRIGGSVPIDPVILYQDKILDGSALYLACLIIGREPRFDTYTGNNPVEYLIGRHFSRGPLSESQRAMAAARASNLQLGDNQYTSEGVPIGAASKLLNVSSRSVNRARFVLRHASPDLIAAVDADRITLNAAETECRRRARQAAKERSAASISAQPVPEPSEQADSISEPNTAGEPNTSPPEADGSTDQASADLLDGAQALSDPADGSEATIVPTAWLWPDYIPSIGVTAVVGHSIVVPVVAEKLAATIAFGGPFPNQHTTDRGEVLWLSTNPSWRTVRSGIDAACNERPNPFYTNFTVLGPEADEFGLPIRHLSVDLRRLSQQLGRTTHVKLIVIDYLSDYLAYGDLKRDIESLGRAIHGLQTFAVEHGVAVLLPMQLPCRRRSDFSLATQMLARSPCIRSVLIVERETGSEAGTLRRLQAQADPYAREHRFHVRQKWEFSEIKIPVIEWDALGRLKDNRFHLSF